MKKGKTRRALMDWGRNQATFLVKNAGAGLDPGNET